MDGWMDLIGRYYLASITQFSEIFAISTYYQLKGQNQNLSLEYTYKISS